DRRRGRPERYAAGGDHRQPVVAACQERQRSLHDPGRRIFVLALACRADVPDPGDRGGACRPVAGRQEGGPADSDRNRPATAKTLRAFPAKVRSGFASGNAAETKKLSGSAASVKTGTALEKYPPDFSMRRGSVASTEDFGDLH